MNNSLTKFEPITFKHDSDMFEGYALHSEDNVLLTVGISTDYQCCEYAGVNVLFLKKQTFDDFIGSTLIEIVIDEKLSETKHSRLFPGPINKYEHNFVTLTVYTSAGKFYIGVFNDHNGYYPHYYYFKFGSREDYDTL